ncbi:MAG TPA: DUF3109 family protein [Bacteroidota bacterium]|nr:DUF3109 family protein [Bacteroidota bacterium]
MPKHKLGHLPQLTVDERLLQPLFAADCSVANCNAACCRHGVMVDVHEKANILDHSDLIRRYMDSHQEHDPAHWFDDWEEEDADFPSGRCTGTQVRDYGCVFLNSAGQCVLQKAATAEGMPRFALKPFFCVAYPITLERGVLTIEDPGLVNRPCCCSIVEHGSSTAMEVCREELEFVLGQDGLNALRQMVQSISS